MLCPCVLLAVPNGWLCQCHVGGTCPQLIQSILKQQLTGQADRQHTVKAFSSKKDREHMVWRETCFLISSPYAKNSLARRKAIAIFAPSFVFTWNLLRMTYCCRVIYFSRSLLWKQILLLNTKATLTVSSFMLLWPPGWTDSYTIFQKSHENITSHIPQNKTICLWPTLLCMKYHQLKSQKS